MSGQGSHSLDRRPVAVTSLGLMRKRRDIEMLLDRDVVFRPASFGDVAAYVGWGLRPSGLRARRLAERHRRPVILLEDGFLKGYRSDLGEPSHSYVVDRAGIYFDAEQPNDLGAILDGAGYAPEDLAHARGLIERIRAERLTKFSSSAVISPASAGVPGDRPFVVVVDQVAHDASIPASGATRATFARMLAAAAEDHPHCNVVIRTHPVAGRDSLLCKAAGEMGMKVIVPAPMNPWPLLEEADAVYTVSSLLGFEALMAGTPVHCFGRSFYGGRGLTIDRVAAASEVPPVSLEHMFLAAYRDYACYLDLHTRRPCSLEHAIDQMICVRDQRNRIGGKVYTAGFSPWKRRATDLFLIGPEGPARHCRTMTDAIGLTDTQGGVVARWGVPGEEQDAKAGLMIEDGFVRSAGLGAALNYPCSLALDTRRPHYDVRGSSDLETLLAETRFDAEVLQRAARLRDRLLELRVTKYNIDGAFEPPAVAEGVLRILVPGQVEADAAIRFGTRTVRTNAALVDHVRRLYPDAFIAYKMHPDAVAGLRSAGATPTAQDITVRDGRIDDWIDWCDRLETMTSLAGFEALVRSKPVGVHGIPFYAGWGLTDDRLPIGTRSRKLTVEELIAGALIAYPFYIHPVSRLPCPVETLVDVLALRTPVRRGPLDSAIHGVSMAVNRLAIRQRDRL